MSQHLSNGPICQLLRVYPFFFFLVVIFNFDLLIQDLFHMLSLILIIHIFLLCQSQFLFYLFLPGFIHLLSLEVLLFLLLSLGYLLVLLINVRVLAVVSATKQLISFLHSLGLEIQVYYISFVLFTFNLRFLHLFQMNLPIELVNHLLTLLLLFPRPFHLSIVPKVNGILIRPRILAIFCFNNASKKMPILHFKLLLAFHLSLLPFHLFILSLSHIPFSYICIALLLIFDCEFL